MGNPIDNQDQSLEISPTTVRYMRRVSVWMIFLSIIGFILTLLILLGAIYVIRSEIMGEMVGPVYLGIALAGFFISLFWLQSAFRFRRFATHANTADAEKAFVKLNLSLIICSITFILYFAMIAIVLLTGSVGYFLMGSPL